jgi:hypothetical protein
MAITYDKIASTTLSSAATNITFSSIAASWTDIKIVMMAADNTSQNSDIRLRFNSDTGSNYSATILRGNGVAPSSYSRTNYSYIEAGRIAGSSQTNVYSLIMIDIFSYAGSTNKTTLVEFNSDFNDTGGNSRVGRIAGLWRNTAAITTIDLSNSGGNDFKAGTTATLYGILRA